MEASTQIEKLISTFLHHLVNNTIMSFNIPRGDSIDDIYQLDCDQTSENNHIVRRLEKVESSRKYAQMFAVVALVAELISGAHRQLYSYVSVCIMGCTDSICSLYSNMRLL